jgi:predicted small lipoprotein YifL
VPLSFQDWPGAMNFHNVNFYKIRRGIAGVMVLVITLLAACGQKGDLYLPDEEEQQKQTEQQKKKKTETSQ